MYGVDDSGRKFYLKVKEILKGMNFEEMHEDNASSTSDRMVNWSQ